MHNNVTIDNNIFLYALTGALLFISSIAFILAYSSDIAMFELSYTVMAFILFASSVSFLYRAIKNDKARQRQMIN